MPAWHWVTAVQDSLTTKNKLEGDKGQKGHTHLCSLLCCECRAQRCLRGFRIQSWAGLPPSLANPCLKSGRRVWVLRHSRAKWRRPFDTLWETGQNQRLSENGENKLVYPTYMKYLLSTYSQPDSCPHPDTQALESFALETCSSLSGSLASSSTNLDPWSYSLALGVTEQPLAQETQNKNTTTTVPLQKRARVRCVFFALQWHCSNAL